MFEVLTEIFNFTYNENDWRIVVNHDEINLKKKNRYLKVLAHTRLLG